MAHWSFTLLYRGTPSVAYNRGSDQAITVKDLTQSEANLTALSIYVPSIANAHELGLSVETTLDESIVQSHLSFAA
jgi:hypothetical protein